MPLPDADAAAAGLGKVDSGYSHSLPDDPIPHPGKRGAAHLHDFFGHIWDQPTLDRLVRDCFHAERDCGRFRGAGPGREP
jgi:hypothetical protein